MSKKATLVKGRSSKELTNADVKYSNEAADKPILDSEDKRTRDINVPLNDYYHDALDRIIKSYELEVGGKVSKRNWASNYFKTFIDAKLNERGLS